MRNRLSFYLCSVITLLVANCSLSSIAFCQYSASVTSAQLQGTPTDGAPASLTVTISRSSNLNTYDILVVCNPPLSDSNHITCGSGGLDFPPGVNTLTVSVTVAATKSVETTSLFVAASYAIDQYNDYVTFNDPGTTVGVSITPDTLSAAVSPNVVPPSGSSPELTISVKNGNGTLVHYSGGLPNPTWDCSTASFTLDYTTNPNVTAQTSLPLIQAPFTQTCNIHVTELTWDGNLTASPTVTYQESPNNADLGPSCPRSGSEATCGSPITLTNGNTWTQADDYELPGLGGGISLRRTWNSQWSSYQGLILAGIFGDSWQSNYEKHIQALSSSQLLYWRDDGSSWFFTSPSKGTWALSTPADERASLTFSNRSGYAITLRDGSVELYDTNGNLTSLQDRNGNKATLTYDTTTFHRLTKVTDAAGRVLTFTYGNSILPKQVTSIQDSVGTIATYIYDSGSHLTSVTYADNSVLNYHYDSNGLLLSITDQLGKILEAHTYDSVRRGLTSQRANGVDSLTVNYYDGTSVDGFDTLTDSKGNSTNYTANTRIGNRWYMTNIQGTGCDSCAGRNNQTFTYDGNGNRTSSADPNGNQTTYGYDSNGNVTQISKNLGTGTQTSVFTWNNFGQVLTATDPLGKVTTNTYDTKGNILTTKTPLGNTTTFTYDTKGELLTIKDPLLNVTTLTYNTVGLIASIKDAQGHVTQFQYDPRGNRTTVIDALNQTASYTYDSRNRLTKITYPTSPATTVQFAYDYRGRRTSVTDANSKITQYL